MFSLSLYFYVCLTIRWNLHRNTTFRGNIIDEPFISGKVYPKIKTTDSDWLVFSKMREDISQWLFEELGKKFNALNAEIQPPSKYPIF